MSTYDNSNLILPEAAEYTTNKLFLLKPVVSQPTPLEYIEFNRNSGNGTYIDSNGVMQYADVNVPRYTHLNGSSCPVLLLEEQRTNIITYTEDFTNSDWVKSSGGTGLMPVVVPNATISPDGNMTADEITFSTGANTTSSDQSFLGNSATILNSTNYSGGFWLKGSVGGEELLIRGVGNITYTKITLSLEWQWFSTTELSISTSVSLLMGLRQGLGGIGTINSNVKIYAWAAQLEEGDYSSSYIPNLTTGSTTRLKDEVNDGNTDVALNEGCIILNYQSFIDGMGADGYLTFEGDANNYIQIRIDATEFIYFKLVASGVTIFNQPLDVNQSDMNEIKFKFKSGDSAVKIGDEFYTDSTLFTFGSPLSTVNFTDELGGNNLIGYVKDLKIGDVSLY